MKWRLSHRPIGTTLLPDLPILLFLPTLQTTPSLLTPIQTLRWIKRPSQRCLLPTPLPPKCRMTSSIILILIRIFPKAFLCLTSSRSTTTVSYPPPASVLPLSLLLTPYPWSPSTLISPTALLSQWMPSLANLRLPLPTQRTEIIWMAFIM